jgi:DNA polymerase
MHLNLGIVMKKDSIQALEWFKEIGVEAVYSEVKLGEAKVASVVPLEIASKDVSAGTSAHELAMQAKDLKALEQAVHAFDGCDLKKLAINTVFADGNPNAEVMLIGEAPGANEDKDGIPFCGQSGKLLNNIILSIGLKRSDAYITNTVFWRPPGNRRPTPEELEICRPFVEKHIALVKPKVIILVGSTAVESLLGSNVAVHDLRNSTYQYKNQFLDASIKTFVIFHPSYLLRQPGKKKLMWFDMLRIKGQI